MWKLKLAAALSLATAAAALAMQPAAACACCSEVAQRTIDTVPLDGDRRTWLELVKFAPEAALYLPAGELEDVAGIASPQDAYTLSVAWTNDRIVLTLKAEGGRGGTLALKAPESLAVFEVDTREARPEGAEPSLYKEWTLSGPAEGTGDFAPSTGQTLKLIYQGRGNSCPSETDFTAWTLEVNGEKADYRLFGALSTS